MQLLYRIEMPPSNRLGVNDNEDHEHGRDAFNINREAHRRPTALQHSRSLQRGQDRFLLFKGKAEATGTPPFCRFWTRTGHQS
jgi:hypothetical protein